MAKRNLAFLAFTAYSTLNVKYVAFRIPEYNTLHVTSRARARARARVRVWNNTVFGTSLMRKISFLRS